MNRERTLMIGMLAVVIAAWCAAAPAVAVSVYECRGKDGVVKFQDSPCLAGETSRTHHLSGDPIVTEQAPPTLADVKVNTKHSGTVAAQQSALVPPSSTFLCEREDGSRYVSDSGVGNRHAIPLGMLGYPPMSLGQAYGGSNGIGISAPGVREAPVVAGRGGSAAGLQTWVEDPCTRVTGAPLCNFYASQMEDAQRRLRFAFSDTSNKVRAEVENWQARVASCRR